MNIFDPSISGSLSVSGSGQISGDLRVLGTLYATVSGTTQNAVSASHAAAYTLTSSFHAHTNSFNNFTSSYSTGSFTGSFIGNGVGLYNIPASGVTGLNLSQISEGSATASISQANGLLINTNTEITGAVKITGSISLNGQPIGTGKLDETVFNSYTSSNNSTNTTQNNRLSALESTTSSLNIFTSSAINSLSSIETSTGSINTFTSSANSRLVSLENNFSSYTGSNDSTNTTQNGRLNALESTSGSINVFTSSANNRLSAIESTTSSINSFTSSAAGNISSLENASSSIRSDFNSYTSSNNTTNSTQNNRLTAIETSTSSLNSFTSSIDSTIKTKLNTEGVISGSVQVNISSTTGYSTFSSSLATRDVNQDGRLSSLEGKTGSYATTGSNIFQGNQIVTGSLYISQDLVVAGSSSIQNITSSQLNIGDNIITVNALNPSVRFGGLAVIDSGSSPIRSGSLLFDSLNDHWVFKHQNTSVITSSIVLMAPAAFNDLGNEVFPTNNRVLKGGGSEHVADSNITDTGTKVSINSNTEVTGSLIVSNDITTATNLVSNFSSGDEGGEINLNKPVTNTTLSSGITIDVWRDRLRIFESGGTNRGGFFNIAGLSTGAGTNFLSTAETASFVEYSNVANKPALVSGSSQITYSGLSGIPSGIVSGSSQITYGGLSGIPSGIISGSVQVDLTSTTNYVSGIKTRLNTENVLSSSAQVVAALPVGTVSGSSQVLNGTTIHSGSFFNGISVVSGSGQISFGGITGVPSGLVSGSSQITYSGISGIPSGIVSGSSQISIASTSGFGTYLNQAVLTTSSPTFSAITIGKSGTDSTITFPAQTNDPGYIKHYESNNTAIMYFNVSDDTNDEFHFGYTGDASTFRLRADGVVLEGAWQGSSISTSYTDAKVTSVSAGTGISVNATTGAVTITNTITNNNQLTNGAGYITSYTETDTLATVTGRGASTSTALSINNTLTVTSGRVIIRTGGANTYGIVSGYDNNNHLMTMRADISGSTSSPTITAGHQSCFVEYAEANDTTGWFFKSSSTGTYQEILRITRSSLTYQGYTVYHSGNIPAYATLSGSNSFTNSYNEFGDGTGSVSNDGGWNGRLNLAGSQHARLDVTSVSDGIITTIYSHIGQGVGRMGTYSNHPLLLMTNGSGRVRVDTSGHLSPEANGTQNLGSSSYRWNTVFTSDLSMSNGIGDYTIVEGEEDLFIYNNKNNKVFKFLLQEVDPSVVPPKKD